MPASGRIAPGRRDAGEPRRWVGSDPKEAHAFPGDQRSRQRDASAARCARPAATADAATRWAPIVLRALAASAIFIATGWQNGFGLAEAGDAAPPLLGVHAIARHPRAALPRQAGLVPASRPHAIRGIDGSPSRAPHLPAAVLCGDAGPRGIDSDGDRLSDEAERALGTDPLDGDIDADGLLDGDEVYRYGTDPRNSDTDGDGLPDGDEVLAYGTNPLGPDSLRVGVGVTEDLAVTGGVRRLWDAVRADASGPRLLPHGGADP